MTRFFSVFFTLIFHNVHACRDSISTVRQYHLTKVAPAVDLFEYHDNDNITWSGATNLLKCAYLTIATCCRPKGILYDSTSGLCRPVFWQKYSPTDIPPLGTGSSALFQIRTTACRPGYEEVQYNNGNENMTTCIQLATVEVDYWTAKSLCSEQNAFLASTKTLGKMAELKSRVQDQDIWIGLDDIEHEMVFVWVEDGTVLSPEKYLELFIPGEPDHGYEQDCVIIRSSNSKLKDVKCSKVRLYFCEAQPGC